MTPIVSLLIPIYNVQHYLEQCLSSALAQTLREIEVICIDDGSTDGSAQILQRFAECDRRLQIISKANSGYGASLNRGLDAARGEYLAILESDDWMEADCLEVLLAQARLTGADVVRGNYWLYWSKPRERNALQAVIPKALVGKTIMPALKHQVFSITPSIWAGLYRRDALQAAGIRFLETPGASYQDTSFAFKTWATARKASLIKDAFVHYRQDNEASSVHSVAKVFCVMDEFAECQRFLQEERPDLLKQLAPVLAKQKFLVYLWNLDRLAPDNRPAFLAAAYKDLEQDRVNGHLQPEQLLPWHQAELQCLLKDPSWFLTLRATREQGFASKAHYYYELGGLSLLLKVVRRTLGQH